MGLASAGQDAGVYPRVCGGTSQAAMPTDDDDGLSPRVRGNPPAPAPAPLAQRSIPACAGEPCTPPAAPHTAGVYPRVCGGTSRRRVIGIRRVGLSPRVRGNRPTAAPATNPSRSIPACAGEPQHAERQRRQREVYPRVCGGTQPVQPRPPQCTGLSPRVRGNHRSNYGGGRSNRSIPACAGEPNPPGHRRPTASVYPRVCGGTAGPAPGDCPGRGLSPRVRGNPSKRWQTARSGGSIPACAGEPTP